MKVLKSLGYDKSYLIDVFCQIKCGYPLLVILMPRTMNKFSHKLLKILNTK